MRKWISLAESFQDILGPEEDDTLDQQQEAEWARVKRVEAAIRDFCNRHQVSILDKSYAINYDGDENEIHISTWEEELTLEQLEAFKFWGTNIRVSPNSAADAFSLNIRIDAHPNLDAKPL